MRRNGKSAGCMRAGVDVVWKEEAATARRLDLLVLSGTMIDRLIDSMPTDPRVLATASREASLVYVFAERVLEMASKTDGDIGDALGNILAHEIGHVLLPGRGHSSIGIMQAGYEFRNLSARRFTAAQAEMIRRDLQNTRAK